MEAAETEISKTKILDLNSIVTHALDFYDRLEALSIIEIGLDLLGDKVTKLKISADYKGICPFHHEKKPSFYLKVKWNKFTCFGCSAAGGPLDLPLHILDEEEGIKYLENKLGFDRKNIVDVLVMKLHLYNRFCEQSKKAFEVDIDIWRKFNENAGREIKVYAKGGIVFYLYQEYLTPEYTEIARGLFPSGMRIWDSLRDIEPVAHKNPIDMRAENCSCKSRAFGQDDEDGFTRFDATEPYQYIRHDELICVDYALITKNNLAVFINKVLKEQEYKNTIF